MFTTIDLFSGAGGVSQALKKHFKIICAVEYDKIIASTYALNHGSDHLLIKDIKKIKKKYWNNLKKKKLDKQELDLLVATPPCQGFSRHSRKKSDINSDERNKLIFQVIKISNIFEPKLVLLENVDNIINFKVFKSFLKLLSNIDMNGNKLYKNKPSYHIRYEVVDAVDFGVPQHRKRLILIAKKIDSFPNVDAFISINQKGKLQSVKPHEIWPNKTIALTLGDYLKQYNLAPLRAGEQDPEDKLHRCRNLSELNLIRIRNTPKNGGSRSDWPENQNLELDCHKKSNINFGDVYGRMDFREYAPTITCGCLAYTKGRFGHPEEDRAISIREAALIQTFPKDYKFTGKISGISCEGSSENIATQIGNAVPVILAENFITRIHEELTSTSNRSINNFVYG